MQKQPLMLVQTKIQEKGGIRFKNYDQKIKLDIPVYVSELVQDNVLAQIVNKIIEGLDMSCLEQAYSRYGSPAFHPKMLLKVWLYGYCSGVYTSRPLAKKLREDLVFIWLSGGQRPSFKTLSSFRSCRMEKLVDEVFIKVLSYLIDQGYVDLEDLYIDGSKWEANANKHKVVWRKNTERYKNRVLERIEALLAELKALQDQEDQRYGRADLAVHQSPAQIEVILSSEEVAAKLVQLNEQLQQQVSGKTKRKMERVQRHLAKEKANLEKYEEQESILAQRNSYSKTDEDATAMRMKDDRLRPGYNAQITTSDQFIVHASLHQNASDSPTLIPHLGQLQSKMEQLVIQTWTPSICADAGYGSEENYAFLEQHQYEGYVKYPLWYQQVSGQLEKRKFSRYNWNFDQQQDCYTCPNGQQLVFKEQRVVRSRNGYDRHLRIYESKNCAGCPLFSQCRSEKAKPGSNRRIQRSEKLEQYQKKAHQLLASEQGKQKRSQRSVDVETPFANLKYNMKHQRFILRGSKKVHIEFQCLAIAHNLKKIYCLETGIWQEHYAHRAARKKTKGQKRA